jgi:uncharacterized membrane protein YoaK (UPF0700 family)
MRGKAPLALAFALIGLAGWVDAVGYPRARPLFVSFMSGNSTQLGVGLGRGQWHAAARAGGIIALYVLGAFACTLVAGAAGKWRLPAVLGVEASLLGSVLLLPVSAGEFPAAAFPTVLVMNLSIFNGLPLALALPYDTDRCGFKKESNDAEDSKNGG